MSRPTAAALIAVCADELGLDAGTLAQVTAAVRLVEAEHGPELPVRSRIALSVTLGVLSETAREMNERAR